MKGFLNMKKILCAFLACAICATTEIGLSGCNNSSNTTQPGYEVPVTEPDLKNDEFGFFILNKSELMITKYLGSSKDVVIPDTYDNYTVAVIGRSVFNDKDINSVVVPDSVREIQDYAFASNKNLKSVTLSKNLKTLGSNVFYHCASLESIELPASIEDFGIYTFSASGLKSVTIPESTTFTTIKDFCFYQCQQLTEVNLPVTITNIADNAFADCPNPITIKAKESSYAKSYAASNNIKFEAVK